MTQSTVLLRKAINSVVSRVRDLAYKERQWTLGYVQKTSNRANPQTAKQVIDFVDSTLSYSECCLRHCVNRLALIAFNQEDTPSMEPAWGHVALEASCGPPVRSVGFSDPTSPRQERLIPGLVSPDDELNVFAVQEPYGRPWRRILPHQFLSQSEVPLPEPYLKNLAEVAGHEAKRRIDLTLEIVQASSRSPELQSRLQRAVRECFGFWPAWFIDSSILIPRLEEIRRRLCALPVDFVECFGSVPPLDPAFLPGFALPSGPVLLPRSALKARVPGTRGPVHSRPVVPRLQTPPVEQRETQLDPSLVFTLLHALASADVSEHRPFRLRSVSANQVPHRVGGHFCESLAKFIMRVSQYPSRLGFDEHGET
ncbi:MAG: hypothetical protein AAF355_15550 [Myxococcota bacterium]